MTWVKLAAVQELEGEVLAREWDGASIALFRVDGSVYAVSNICTHDYALLSDGFVENGCVECPLHAARFDVRTGEVLCGPATSGLKRYATELRGDEIWVDV